MDLFATRFSPGTVDVGGVQLGGEGLSGLVFCIQHLGTAVKVARDPDFLERIRDEFKLYKTLKEETAWDSRIIVCPAPGAFFNSVLALEKESQVTIPELSKAEKKDCCCFTLELISPMSKSKWGEIPGTETRRPALAHLMLGRKLVKIRAEDTGEPVDVGYETARSLGVDVNLVAKELGKLIAHFHFALHTNANDVEIVLGANDSPAGVGVYVIDLSNVGKFTGPADALTSIELLGGYIPRPGSEMWPEFKSGYLDQAASFQASDVALEVVRLFEAKAAKYEDIYHMY